MEPSRTPALLSLLLIHATSPLWAAATYFVDPRAPAGQNGSASAPFSSLAEAAPHLRAGDTLNLKGGMHLGMAVLRGLQGLTGAPITIQSAPGESVVLDAGVPQARELDNADWEPVPDGAPDEFRTVFEFPSPASALFIDSKIRLLAYSNPNDFRAANELIGAFSRWTTGTEAAGMELDGRPGPEILDARTKQENRLRRFWAYCGPGTYWNPETKRLHIRLSPTHVAGLVRPHYTGPEDPRIPAIRRIPALQTEVADYRGGSDPRKLRISLCPIEQDAISLIQCRHLVLRNLVLQNGGNALLTINECQDITFEDIVFLQGKSTARFANSSGIRFLHCEFDGGLPPWSFRSDFKFAFLYRGPDGKPVMNDWVRWTSRSMMGGAASLDGMEVAWCEFRNAHDLYLTGRNIRFHHNLVEDIHDDALFITARGTDNIHVFQNVVRRSMQAMAFTGNTPEGTRFIYRNIIDLREPTRSFRPDSSEGGTDAWRVLFLAKMGKAGPFSAYQNTFLFRRTDTITSGTSFPNPEHPRQLFNNIFVGMDPDAPIVSGMSPEYPAQRDGNIFFRPGRTAPSDLFPGFADLPAFRASPDFAASKQWYPPGWEAVSQETDPKFASFRGEVSRTEDLRLNKDSPARGAGIVLPEDLDDPLRPSDGRRPDAGALPFGSDPLKVGRHGRYAFPGEN